MKYSEWSKISLEKVILTQIDNRGRNPENYLENGKFPVLDNFMIKNEKYPNLKDTKRFIDELTYNTFIRNYLKKNDVVITLVGAGIGNVTMIPNDEVVIIQNTLGLRCNEKMKNEFLYYLLRYKYYEIIGFNRGSAQPSIRKTDILSMSISAPNIQTQEKIINILSSLDDKIELNKKINNNLEELAQTLYKHWFVDFEFPNEEGLPYKSSGGEMVKSEFGLIPKGWEVKELGSACDIKYGKNFPTKNLLQNGFPVFGGNGVIGYSESFIYKEPQTLVACRGAASGKVQVSLPKSFVTNNSLVLLHNNTLKYAYLKEFSISRGYYDFVTGSAQPQITIASISKCKILVPKYSVQQVFSDTLQETYDMILNLDRQGETLAKTRDLLLPKLMSGDLRVPIEE